MKRFTLASCAGLLAAAIVSPSFAADMPLKGPPMGGPFNWTGFYLGINGGYGFGTTNWTLVGTGATTGDFNFNGGLVGGTVGYNQQMGVWVFGAEGDVDASWIKGTDSATCGAPGCETKNTWLGTARLRAGYAAGRVLPYLTGGAAFGNVTMTTPTGAGQSDTRFGWTIGAGIEFAAIGAWSFKAEYLYADLGKANCSAATCGLGANADVAFKTNVVRVGVNYHF